MDNITELLGTALDRYFDSLKTLGYMPDKEIESLLVLLYIQELMSNLHSTTLWECQYRILLDALYCLMGRNCMIDFTELTDMNTYFGNIYSPFYARISEEGILRDSEAGKFREPNL